ncbi:MAG: DUF4139 domain-containing protein [Thermodesulfovibrionales bacterium]
MREINQIAGEKEKSKEVLISLDAPAPTDGMMIISYLVEGAGWSPVYDVRVDSNIPTLSIDYIASIRQSTGEDWKGISLTLTTQKPVTTGKIPELNPWYLDIYSPPPFVYKGAMLREKSVIPEELPPEEEEQTYELPEAITELTSVSFSIPYRVDIPSDGEPHRIVIATSRADAEIKYYSVPKLLRSAIATVSSKNPFSFPMLSGEVNLFLDGRYVNSSFLEKPVVPEDKILLSPGIDEGIKIERKLDRKFTEYSRTFTKSTVVNYEYSIVITNGKGRDINIEVKDHAPVSRNEKIKVELKEPLRTDAEISEDGIILWRLKLNKGETKRLSIKFAVEYPRDLRITGFE